MELLTKSSAELDRLRVLERVRTGAWRQAGFAETGHYRFALTLGEATGQPIDAEATVPPAVNVIDFRAARARRYEEAGLDLDVIETSQRLAEERQRRSEEIDRRLAEIGAGLDKIRADREAAEAARVVPPVTGAAAQAAVEALAGMIERRHFSAMLLAWSLNPEQQGMLPNASLTAGVLVELCHRMDALEAKAPPSPRKPRKKAMPVPSPSPAALT